MQLKTKNPWEGSFENLTVSTAKPVKKAVGEAVLITVEDVRKQLFGEKPPKEMSEQESLRVEEQEKKKLAEMKGRVAGMEEEIKKIREARLEKEVMQAKQAKRAERAKRIEKKNEGPIWKKMMKMRSQAEQRVNAGG